MFFVAICYLPYGGNNGGKHFERSHSRSHPRSHAQSRFHSQSRSHAASSVTYTWYARYMTVMRAPPNIARRNCCRFTAKEHRSCSISEAFQGLRGRRHILVAWLIGSRLLLLPLL